VATVVMVLVAGGVWWLSARDSVQEKEAMLRVLKAPVQMRPQAKDAWREAGDLTPLVPGGEVEVGEGGLAAVQFFDGSIIKMEGGSQLRVMQSLEGRGKQDKRRTSVKTELVRGRVTVKVAKLASPESSFLFFGRSTVGATEGTVFEAEVLPDGGTRWSGGEGVMRVAALTVDNQGKVQIALVRLDAGLLLEVPPLPAELQGETVDRLIQTAAQLASRSAASQKAEVTAKGVRLLAADSETGNAVYEISKTLMATTLSPSEDRPRMDPLLAKLAPFLLIERGAVSELPYIPELPLPQSWMQPGAPRPKPTLPSYFYSIYGPSQPIGVGVDPQRDRLYVTEEGGERQLKVFNLEGKLLASLSPPGTSPLIRTPVYVAVDSKGRVLVSDRRRHVIDMWSPEGEYLGLFLPTMNWSPLGLAFDRDDNLYITEVSQGVHRVIILDRNGVPKLEFGVEGREPGQFSFPNKALPSDDGSTIYVSDSNNARVQVFDSRGQLQGVIGGGSGEGALAIPRGLALDGDKLLVVDTLDSDVHAYEARQGTFRLVFSFGQAGIADGQFNYPQDVVGDGKGRLYIADTRNSRVQVWGY